MKRLKRIIQDCIFLLRYKLTKQYKGNDVWLFNSGNEFTGNVKHLYLYILENRPDIRPFYIADTKELKEVISKAEGRAFKFNSIFGRFYSRIAKVYVTDQFKEKYPINRFREDLINLNLWHGVGLKTIERRSDIPHPAVINSICKKYIQNNSFYVNKTLFLVTSRFMEHHFKYNCDLDDAQIIRAGYPRNFIEHKIKSDKARKIVSNFKINKGKRIVLYAPTYREQNNFLHQAIPDIKKLIQALKETNSLLIIKLHSRINNDFLFKTLLNYSKKSNEIYLWDNKDDIYEIFDLIDVGIIDYSSIYYDLLAGGVTKFIRYIFDYKDNSSYLAYDYYKNTTGLICDSFESLIDAIKKGDEVYEEYKRENNEIKEKFWEYSMENNCDYIISKAKEFTVLNKEMKNLYSFDIFDTLIARKVLEPKGIFFYVMEKIRRSNTYFPCQFINNYPEIRIQAEQNAREETKKRIGHFEISFDQIFEKLSSAYQLDKNQISLLKQWEIDAELENVIPIQENIDKCEDLIRNGETVILISDMYLPKHVITNMLMKVSMNIADIPIFLSNEIGFQKTTKKLYHFVFKHFAPWRFHSWVHHGDNKFADGKQAQSLGIKPILHKTPSFNNFEKMIVQKYSSYDGYLLAGMIARKRFNEKFNNRDYFGYAHASAYFYPYIFWVINNALKKKIDTLYFISRDGHILKAIADKLIKLNNYKIKIKYIYGSRKAWRIPSQINAIDDEFFGPFGNLSGVTSYSELLESIRLTDSKFRELFPEISQSIYNNKIDNKQIREFLSCSLVFKKYLLARAKKDRELVCQYLKQEINFDERFAFVEYWGRGYTQTCLTKLLTHTLSKEVDVPFYYYRSIYSSEGRDIRFNYSTNNNSLLFVEAIFANHPFQTLQDYYWDGDKVQPKLIYQEYDDELFRCVSDQINQFIDDIHNLPLLAERELLFWNYANVAFDYMKNNQDAPIFVESLAHLKDNVSTYATKTEFAPKFDLRMLFHFLLNHKMNKYTRSISMSISRSNKFVKFIINLCK